MSLSSVDFAFVLKFSLRRFFKSSIFRDIESLTDELKAHYEKIDLLLKKIPSILADYHTLPISQNNSISRELDTFLVT